jgi:hypothetical protein
VAQLVCVCNSVPMHEEHAGMAAAFLRSIGDALACSGMDSGTARACVILYRCMKSMQVWQLPICVQLVMH